MLSIFNIFNVLKFIQLNFSRKILKSSFDKINLSLKISESASLSNLFNLNFWI